MPLSDHPALRAFRHRAFRIFYAGQFLSVLGSWLQTVATSWLVYRLTGSAFLLGLTAFAGQIPLLVVAPIAGVMADRFNRRKLLLAVQSIAFAQSVLLTVLTASGMINVWIVIALAFWLGVANAIEVPTRQAFLLDMVEDRADLPNAIALQSLIMNSTRFIGPSIAGIMLALWGEAACFGANAVSYFAILLAYALLRTKRQARPSTTTPWWRQLAEGFRYAFGHTIIRRALLLLAAIGFFSAPWQTLLPIYAAESFGGDSRTFGFLIGAVGAGAICGTLYLAARPSVRGLTAVIRATSIVAPLMMMLFAFAQQFWQAIVILPIFGCTLVMTIAALNSIIQTIADDAFRGRVVAIYVMAFLGIAPLGNFAGGALAEWRGAHQTFLVNGVLLLAAALWFLSGLRRWREGLRVMYESRGV